MAKGGSFEREISVLLSKWWTEGERDDIFGRSDGSGGRFTARKKKGKDTANQGGDITFIDSIGEPLVAAWSIEAKTGYGTKKKIKDKDGEVVSKETIRWDVLDFLDSKQKEPVLQKMWTQCRRDAELTNREPILIFRRNGRAPCICFYKCYLGKLLSCFGMPSCGVLSLTTYDYEADSLCMMKLSDFFEWIPNIRAALKRRKR